MKSNQKSSASPDQSTLRVSGTLPLVNLPNSPRANLEASHPTVPRLAETGATDLSLPVQAFWRDSDKMSEFVGLIDQLFAQHTTGIGARA